MTDKDFDCQINKQCLDCVHYLREFDGTDDECVRCMNGDDYPYWKGKG